MLFYRYLARKFKKTRNPLNQKSIEANRAIPVVSNRISLIIKVSLMKMIFTNQHISSAWGNVILTAPKKLYRFWICLLAFSLPLIAQASPDFSIFYDGNSIQLSDQMGGNDVITVTEVAGNIQFDIPGRTYAINGGATLNFPVSIPLAGATSLVIFGGEGDDIINIGAFATVLPDMNIGGGDGNDEINFKGDINFLADASLDVNLQDDAPFIGTDKIIVAVGTNLRLAGLGNAVFKASQSIAVLTNGSVETQDGNITVEANLQTTPSTGNFKGVELNGGQLDIAGDGYLTVKGKGGNNAAGFQQGVSLLNNAAINGGDIHATYVQGWGGPSSGIRNYGVGVESGSTVSSNGGSVTVVGVGNGNGAAANGHGILVNTGGLVSAGGNGEVIIDGTGCKTCDGTNNSGLAVAASNAQVNSTNGNVTITGLAGGTSVSGNNMGVNVFPGGFIYAGGAGNIQVTGTGGRGSQGFLRGVNVQTGTAIIALGTGSVTIKGTGTESTGNFNIGVAALGTIASTNGDVSVTGFGGGIGASSTNFGVYVQSSPGISASINAGGAGKVKVVGNGAYDATGNSNIGVAVVGNLASIDSDNGNVEIIGTGGGAGASGLNAGVAISSQGLVFAGGTGAVSIQGLGGKGSGNGNVGVSIESSSLVNSGGGNVSVVGQGTGVGTSGLNHGVQVAGTAAPFASIQAGANGHVSVRGTAGNSITGADNYGVLVSTFGQIAGTNGNVDVVGQGGGQAPASGGIGVYVRNSGQIITNGIGTIAIKGTGGTGVGPSNIGVLLANSAVVASTNGNITVTGIEGTSSLSNGIKMSETALIDSDANIELIANSILIGATASITNGTNNTVTLRQYTNSVAINLGTSTDPIGGPLNLTDAELDRITTGNIVIGNNVSGNITVANGITRPAQTNMTLITAGSIHLNASSLNTAGGLLTFQAAQGVFPTVAGVDVEVGTVAFAPGTALNIHITGTTPDVGYPQLNVVGIVNLTGSKLALTGTYIQPQCNPVVLVKNDGTDAVIGTFNGLPEGFVFTNYLGSGLSVQITYVGGDGNDVVLIERVKPTIMCPANIAGVNDFGFCGKTLDFIGTPMVVENCSFTLSDNAPSVFNIGETEVTWVVTDANGNTASCIQTVTIKDTEFPTFDCPTDIVTVNQEDFDCGAQVAFNLTGTDNCGGFIIGQSHFSGDVFDMGITYVQASITDASGNTTTCEFKIQVDPRAEVCNGIDDDCDGYTDELQDWELQNALFAADPVAGNRFGESVDLKGNWAIGGSNMKNATGEQIGTAYILNHDANTGEWGQVKQLFPDNFSAGDQFYGAKVAMGNGYCAVSAPLDDEGSADAGAVYLYKFNGNDPSDWVFYQKITGINANEQIGSSLDFSADGLLIIGASLNSDNSLESGAAYIFAQTPVGTGNWNLVKKLGANDPNFADHFGNAVAISGDYALVGSNNNDEKGVDAGAAYLFGRNVGGANNWGQIKKIMAPDGEDDDNFGVSVDIDAAWAVIGANKDDDNGNESGSAYVFYKNQGGVADSWNQHVKMRDFNGKKGEHYGYDVSIDGDHFVVGARWKKIFQSRAGAIFVYHREDSGWAEFAMLTEPDNKYNDNLGTSVAIDNQFIIGGIPGDDLPPATDCGAVLVFAGVCGEGVFRPQGKLAERGLAQQEALTMQCFPVPFDQILNIQVNTQEIETVDIRVFNIMGMEVATLYNGQLEGANTLTWDASLFPAGNYFIRMSTAESTISQTVIRIK